MLLESRAIRNLGGSAQCPFLIFGKDLLGVARPQSGVVWPDTASTAALCLNATLAWPDLQPNLRCRSLRACQGN